MPETIDPHQIARLADNQDLLGVVNNAIGFALYAEDGREVHAPGGLTPAIQVTEEEQENALRVAKAVVDALAEWASRLDPVETADDVARTLAIDPPMDLPVEQDQPETWYFDIATMTYRRTEVAAEVDYSFVPISQEEENDPRLTEDFTKETGSSVMAATGVFYTKIASGPQLLVPRGTRGEIVQLARDVDGDPIALVVWESDPEGVPRPVSMDHILGRDQIYHAVLQDGVTEPEPDLDYLKPEENTDA